MANPLEDLALAKLQELGLMTAQLLSVMKNENLKNQVVFKEGTRFEIALSLTNHAPGIQEIQALTNKLQERQQWFDAQVAKRTHRT